MLRRTLALTATSFALFTATAGATERVWSQTGPMTDQRHSPAATLLNDGRALFIGGFTQTAEVYDPAANAWTAVAAPARDRHNAAAVTLRDGRVLVVGGEGPDGFLRSAELYDPATNQWTPAGRMNDWRGSPAAVLLADGRVMVIDGDADGEPEIFDPGSRTWSPTAEPNLWREHPTLTALADGRVLVAGAMSTEYDGDIGTSELYDPRTNTWSTPVAMNELRSRAHAARLPDGRVLVAGGTEFGRAQTSDTAEIFDPATGRWTATGRTSGEHGQYSVMVSLADGTPMLIGGFYWIGSNRYFASNVAEIYNAATGTWRAAAPMLDRRWGHAAVAFADGSVVVAGGGETGSIPERFVTLETVIGGPVLQPFNPTPTAPPATPAPAKVAGTIAFARPLPRKLKVSRGTVTVKLRCTGGACTDKLVLKRWRTTLASGAVKAADGQTVTLKLKLRGKLKARKTSVSLELATQKTTLFASLRR